MRRRASLMALVAVVVALAATGCERDRTGGAGQSGSSAAGGKLKLAVIPKGTTHEFWKSVHAGAVKAARELDVQIVYQGPLKEDDLKQQIDLVQSFTAQRVNGIVLAPLNDKALVKVVKDATRAKIPVVVIDSGLQGEHHDSFIATDNLAAGKLAGQHMVELLGAKGAVAVLRYQEGSASTANREQGFLEAVRAQGGIEVLSDNQYGGATTESALKASENLLLAQRAADGALAGVFCPNESTTFGMLRALEKAGLGGKIKLVGFDASDKLVAALGKGHISALVVQDPFRMGYLGVKTMVERLRGAKVERVIDTGSTLVTAANMKEPAIAALLHPELDKWLAQ